MSDYKRQEIVDLLAQADSQIHTNMEEETIRQLTVLVRNVLDERDQARDICREIIDRVDSGRIRSQHTYARCKALINGMPDPGRKT